MTRTRLIQWWFSLVMLMVIGMAALGIGFSATTGAVMLALSCVPAGLVLRLWPAAEPATATVMHRRTRSL